MTATLFENRAWPCLAILILIFQVLNLHDHPEPALAQGERPVSLTATPGMDGYCKEGNWFPIHLTVENSGPDLTGEVKISMRGYGNEYIDYAQPLILPGQSRKKITLSVYPLGFLNEIEAVFQTQSQVIARTSFRVTCIGQADALFGIFSDNPSGFNRLLDADPPGGRAFIAQLAASDIPDRFQALQALSALFISDVDTFGLSKRQLLALTGYVASGGHLIIFGGPGWQRTTAGISELLPLVPTHTQILPGLDPLNKLIGEDLQLTGETITTQGILNPRTHILAEINGAPLLLQESLGGGQISFLAANPNLSPLDQWDNFPALVQYLQEELHAQYPGAWSDGFQSPINAIEAVSTIPGLSFPSVILICGFLILYILAVGPANYFILHRWGLKEFAWFSIPLLVILFSGMAFLVGVQTEGRRPILNSLNVVQSWPDTQFSRFDSLIGLYSPTRNIYDIELIGDRLAHPIPENTGSPTQDWRFIQDQPFTIVDDMQVEIGGVRAFASSGEMAGPLISHTLQLTLGANQPTISGEVQIERGPPLTDAVLLTPHGAVRLDELIPGKTYPFQFDILATKALEVQGQNGKRGSANLDLIEQIIGSPYFPAVVDDPQFQSRIALLNAFLDPSGQTESRGSRFILAGWNDMDLPFEIQIPGHPLDRNDLTLYLITLDIPWQFGDSRQISLPPGLFTWRLLAPDIDVVGGEAFSPYDTFIPPGTAFDLQFNLDPLVTYQDISTLDMHLESDQEGIPPPRISLWNSDLDTWEKQPDRDWGSHSITTPGLFVSNTGEIRVRVELEEDVSGVYLRSLDFTMTVDRGNR
jgi:hypothetical protein